MSDFLDSIVLHTYNNKNNLITTHYKMIVEIFNTRCLNGPLRDYHYSYINCWNNIDDFSDFWLFARYIVNAKRQANHHNIKIKNIIMNINKLEGIGFMEFCKTIYHLTPLLTCNNCLHHYIILDVFYYLTSLGYNVKAGIIYKNTSSINNFIKEIECNQIIKQQIKEIVKTL